MISSWSVEASRNGTLKTRSASCSRSVSDRIRFLASRDSKFSGAFESLKHQLNLPANADDGTYLFGCESMFFDIGDIKVVSCEAQERF